MAETLRCGRQEMCESCLRLDRESHIDVCIAVGVAARTPGIVGLSKVAINGILFNSMSASAGDEDSYVTDEMRDAAQESIQELIRSEDKE